MFDIDACALAISVTDEEHPRMIEATWSINEYIRKERVLDGGVLMYPPPVLPSGILLVEECILTSAGNNARFIRQLQPELAADSEKRVKAFIDA